MIMELLARCSHRNLVSSRSSTRLCGYMKTYELMNEIIQIPDLLDKLFHNVYSVL